MFNGKEQNVKLLVANYLAGVIIDRFGNDVMMIPKDDEYFTVNVQVHVSRQFLGWIISLGEGVKIISPDEVVEQMKEEYWELFMTSGKIDDYLNYKNSRKADGSSGRKERRESDYTDRDSTLYDAGRRV